MDREAWRAIVHGIARVRHDLGTELNCWIIEKPREFQKNIYSYFIDYAKAFDYVNNKLWKILKEMEIPDYLIFLLRNLYAGQEAYSENWTWNNGLVQNWERSMSKLYIVTLFI